MRTWRYGAVLALAVIVIAGVYWWYAGTRKVRITPSPDLSAELELYRAAGNNWRKKCAIANAVAASHTQLWEKCGQKLNTVEGNNRLAIGHFASAYYKRGPQQQEELISLLHSQDIRLVGELLTLLCYTAELGPNEEWQ